MIAIPTSVVKRVPYVSSVGLALDIKEIAENATSIGAAKIIPGRVLNECTPPELLIAGKCVILAGRIVASVATGGNPLVVSGTVSAARPIIRNYPTSLKQIFKVLSPEDSKFSKFNQSNQSMEFIE